MLIFFAVIGIIDAFKRQIEATLKVLLFKTISQSEKLPKQIHGIMVTKAAGSFGNKMKNNYLQLVNDFKKENIIFNFNEEEYHKFIDGIIMAVLKEFITFSG